jgi:hypothetical protein
VSSGKIVPVSLNRCYSQPAGTIFSISSLNKGNEKHQIGIVCNGGVEPRDMVAWDIYFSYRILHTHLSHAGCNLLYAGHNCQPQTTTAS